MSKLNRGQQIHEQFLHYNLKLDDCLRRYEQATTEGEQHRILLGIIKYRILLYWNHIQKYLWLKSCGYKHDQIRHWLDPFC